MYLNIMDELVEQACYSTFNQAALITNPPANILPAHYSKMHTPFCSFEFFKHLFHTHLLYIFFKIMNNSFEDMNLLQLFLLLPAHDCNRLKHHNITLTTSTYLL